MASHDPYDVEGGMPLQTDSESHFDVRESLLRLRRRWRLIASVLAVALLVAVVQFAITPKEYRATATVQIERRAITPFASSQTPWLDNWWNLEYYPTQYRLLESRGLAERVVQDLRLMDDAAFNPGAAARAQATGTPPTAADDRAVLGGLATRLQWGLSVEPVPNTQLVRLVYRSSAPDFAARMANGFAQSFIDWGIESRSTTVGKASDFLGKQIEDLKNEIADRDAQLQAYSRSEDIVDFNPGSNVTFQRLAALNKDYIEAVRNRIEKQAHYEEVASTPKESVADAQSSGLVSDLMKEQLQLERDYATQLKTFKPDWPPLVELKSKIDRGREYLDSVVDQQTQRAVKTAYAEYQTALRQEQKLTGEIETLKREAMDQNLAAVGFSNLQIEIKTRRELLDDLLRRQSETEVAARLQDTRESNVRIVDEALVPSGPYRPSLPKNVSTGLLAGLLLGLAAAFLVEYLDRSVKTAEELERLIGVPVLAVIPDVDDRRRGYGYGSAYGYGRHRKSAAAAKNPRWIDRKKAEAVHVELAPHDHPRQLVSEAYRSLRTSLLLSTTRKLEVVAITSAESGEGKTATVTNLGVVFAQLGRRVLIIDGDLRKPRLHEVFGVSNRAGLVSHLTGGATLDQIVCPTSVPNLFVVPCGPIPPNPSELLSSERMGAVLASLRERFDLVIVDTPPVLAVTDGTIIGSLADGVVLCFHAGKVQRADTKACRDRLMMSEVRILGAVFNRYREPASGYGRRYKRYATYGEPAPETSSSADSAA